MANDALVTTGLVPLTIGSVETFQAQPFLNSLPWDWTGGVVLLTLQDPNGNQTVINATVQGRGAVATWTVVAPQGNWTRAWTATDSIGRHQVSRPIVFTVESSP